MGTTYGLNGTVETYTYDAANNKITETLTNPNSYLGGRTDPVRTTKFEYDLDNRLITQTFDPDASGHTGIKLQQQLAYDKEGNVVTKLRASTWPTTRWKAS